MPIQNINGKLRFEPTAEQTAERTEHIDAREALQQLSDRLDTAQAALDFITDDTKWGALTVAQREQRYRQGIIVALRLAISAARVALPAGRWILRQR